MKKYLIIPLCSISLLNGMIALRTIDKPREWNAQDYANGNSIQQKVAVELLQDKKIQIKNKIIFDIGSGTGNISALMAKDAEWVHGIDASFNMISWAKSHYEHVKNLTFEQCLAERFDPPAKCDLITLFWSLHWIKNANKKIVLKNCYNSLKQNGELIGNIRTIENGSPISLIVLQEISQLKSIAPLLNENILKESGTGSSYLTHKDLETMLRQIGFTQINLETKVLNFTFKNINEIEKFERPVMMNRPFMQSLTPPVREQVFSLYINTLLTKLKKDQNGHYINPEAQTTVIYCRKEHTSKL